MRHLEIYAALRAVVQAGSIRKATETLRISPATLARQIQGMEEELGVVLFERTRSGVRLTPGGEVYYRQFIEHLAQISRARMIVGQLEGGRIGVVRLLVSPETAQVLAPGLATRFRAMAPGLQVKLIPGAGYDPAPVLEGHGADLALVVLADIAPELEVLVAADLPLVALRRAPGPVRLEHLGGPEMVLPSEGSRLRGVIELFAARRRLTLQAGLEVPAPVDPALLPEDAVQVWPLADVAPDWRARYGRETKGFALPTVPLRLVQRAASSLTPPAQRFAALVARAMEAAEDTNP